MMLKCYIDIHRKDTIAACTKMLYTIILELLCGSFLLVSGQISNEAAHVRSHIETPTGNGNGQTNNLGQTGIHIDAPGQHGNKLNEPALHLPPGATVEDARAAGFIPGPVDLGPGETLQGLSRSGVLPGNMNDPAAKAGDNAFLKQSGFGKKSVKLVRSDRRKHLGDLPGMSAIPFTDPVGLNDYDRTDFGVVDGRSVLLTKGGRKRGGRRGGRGRGRGRGRGGRKKRKTTTTTTTTVSTTTTTTTTTTPAPKKSGGGGGVTIIRTSRPNPLAALGNAFRSALNIRNSGGGGLLGSLIGPAVGIQQGFGPPPGSGMVGPFRIQSVGGPLFGGLFRGK